jgi:hypothetical protein
MTAEFIRHLTDWKESLYEEYQRHVNLGNTEVAVKIDGDIRKIDAILSEALDKYLHLYDKGSDVFDDNYEK